MTELHNWLHNLNALDYLAITTLFFILTLLVLGLALLWVERKNRE